MRPVHNTCVGLPYTYKGAYTCMECRAPNSTVHLKKILSNRIAKCKSYSTSSKVLDKYRKINGNKDMVNKKLRAENKRLRAQNKTLLEANRRHVSVQGEIAKMLGFENSSK